MGGWGVVGPVVVGWVRVGRVGVVGWVVGWSCRVGGGRVGGGGGGVGVGGGEVGVVGWVVVGWGGRGGGG